AEGRKAAQCRFSTLAPDGLDDLCADEQRDVELAREVLDAARQVDGVADHRVLEAAGTADVAESGLAIVQADADSDGAAPGPVTLAGPSIDAPDKGAPGRDRLGSGAAARTGGAEGGPHAVPR